MRAQALQRSIHKLAIHLARRQIVDTPVNDPATFFADPRLFLREIKDEIEDLGPFGKRYGRLEEDGGFDDGFCSEQTAEMVIALLLLWNAVSTIFAIQLRVSTNLSGLAARGICLHLPDLQRI